MFLVACAYFPAGNKPSKSVYSTGAKLCTSCPGSACSPNFNGLC